MRRSKFFRLLKLTVLVCLSAVPLGALATTLETLTLDSTEVLYDVNTSPHASGFFIPPEGVPLQDIPAYTDNDELLSDTAFSPDFLKSPRHWLYLPIDNQTDNTNWVVHVSTVIIDRVELYVSDGNESYSAVSDLSQGVDKELINVLGRGFPIQLAEQGHYLLALELSANRYIPPTYVGLMSQVYYDSWTFKLDYLYKIPIGIILGFVLIAVICGIVLWDATFVWFGVSSLLLFALFFSKNYLVLNAFQVFHQPPPWAWILVPVAYLSMLMFVRSFLLVNSDPLVRLFNMTIVISVVVFVFGFFLPRPWVPLLYLAHAICIVGVTLYSGTVKMLREGRYYILFILGWLPILGAIAQFLIFRVANSAIPDSRIAYNIIQESYFQIAHMAIHFLAMLIRILSLKKQKLEAEALHETKSQFLAEASHDLRQPLHSMGMFLSHLKAHVDEGDGQKLVDKMSGLHQSMNDSFTALMDLSRLEAGAISVDKEYFLLQPVIDKVSSEFEADARLRGLRLRVRRTSKIVHSDPQLLERILRSLIANAIKYTNEGGVLVGCRMRGSRLLLQVWDTGCGISKAKQPTIFDVYERTKVEKDHLDGMGVGLSNAKHLADVLGHPLHVLSRERSGSMFEISVPVIESSSANNASFNSDSWQQACAHYSSKLIIVVEISDPILDEQIKASLDSWGYHYYSRFDYSTALVEFDQAVTLTLTDAKQCDAASAHASSVSDGLVRGGLVSDIRGLFTNNVTQQQAQQLKTVGIHALTTDYRPAQLRSLIQYSELILSRGSSK